MSASNPLPPYSRAILEERIPSLPEPDSVWADCLAKVVSEVLAGVVRKDLDADDLEHLIEELRGGDSSRQQGALTFLGIGKPKGRAHWTDNPVTLIAGWQAFTVRAVAMQKQNINLLKVISVIHHRTVGDRRAWAEISGTLFSDITSIRDYSLRQTLTLAQRLALIEKQTGRRMKWNRRAPNRYRLTNPVDWPRNYESKSRRSHR